ncbi:hypothetical protein KSF78_0009004 [Schistosoma japonicum]|nr:hypothetical protein KSF78_0009004 [Schistosoma japonicum]
MTDSGDSEKMLLSFLLFFNVFILLVYSSPQDKKAANLYKDFTVFDAEVEKFKRKINEKLERQNGTINEYVDCKINNLNANHGLTIRFCLISKMRSIYGEYVTDEDEENWTICIMYHEEKSKKSDNFVQANRVSKNAKKAAEYNIEKCKKLASPYPYDLNELDSLLLERQAVVLLSTNCLYERHKQ